MIQVICGKKGSGKTKRILDLANSTVDKQHGDVIFVDDDARYMFDLRHEVRFVNASEYGIHNPDMLCGFISGMLSQNFDISAIFIDAFLKIAKTTDAESLQSFFAYLETCCKDHNVDFVISVSSDPEELPAAIHPYFI